MATKAIASEPGTESHTLAPSDPHILANATGPTPDNVRNGDGKPKKARKQKKAAPSDVRPETLAKFPWHKYPEATQHLCKIKDQLLRQGPDGKRVRGMAKLKEQTRDELLSWWDDHTKEGRNKGDMHELIRNFYKNRLQLDDWEKYDGSADGDSTTPPVASVSIPGRDAALGASLLDGVLAPLLQALKGRARAASTIWAEEHPEEVEAHKKKIPRLPGFHQKAVAALFGELSEEEREFWQAKADEEKAAVEQDSDSCFKNQEAFPDILVTLLDSLIGHSPKQIGSALIDYRLAMRAKDGRIKLYRYTVGLNPGDEPFAEFEGGPSQDDVNRWRNYVDLKLPPNPMRQDDRLHYTADGLPKLPPYDRTWSTELAAEVLQVWLEHMWAYLRNHGEMDLPQALDWELIMQDPAAFIPPMWLDRGIRDPNDIEFFNMPVVYYCLFEAQDTADAFMWKASQPPMPKTGAPAIPATPRRNTRVIFSSPTKATPRAPATRLPPIPSPIFEHATSEEVDPDTLNPELLTSIGATELTSPGINPSVRTSDGLEAAPENTDLDGSSPDGAHRSTPADDDPTSPGANVCISTSLDAEGALEPGAASSATTSATVELSKPVDSPPVHTLDLTYTVHTLDLACTVDSTGDADVMISDAVGGHAGGDAQSIRLASDPEGNAAEKDGMPNTPAIQVPDRDLAPITTDESEGKHASDMKVGGNAPGPDSESVPEDGEQHSTTQTQKRLAPVAVAGNDRPSKHQRPDASMIIAGIQPTRRSSRARTGAAAGVSYCVLDGGKDSVSGSSAAAKGSGGVMKKSAAGKGKTKKGNKP